MCPGLREWWLHKGPLNLQNLVIFKMYTQTVFRNPCRYFVCVKWLARLSIFIHADILVLISEFVVVVILSEWFGGHCRPLWAHPCMVNISKSQSKFLARRPSRYQLSSIQFC